MKYTVAHKSAYHNTTSEVAFDGTVYRWTSNDRVPPRDSIRDYGIDKLPNFNEEAHNLARDADLEAFLREAYPDLKPLKKKRTTIKEQAIAQIEVARLKVMEKLRDLPSHPMGHAFLWGTVAVTLKNGNIRTYRTCFGGICCEDLSEAVKLAKSVPNVSNVYYNLD